MELLRPTRLPVHDGELDHHSGLVLEDLLLRQRLTTVNLEEDGVDLRLRVVLSIELLDTVVRQAATYLLEELVTYAQRLDYILELLDLDTRHLGQLVDIGLKVGGNLYGHRLIGTPRRQHLHLEAVGGYLEVVLQRVDRIVGRADRLHVVVLHQATRIELGLLQLLGADIVDLTSGRGVEELLHTESGLKLQVGPVVKRVTHRIGNRLGPLLKLLPVGRILARAIALIDTVRTHGAPLVVVTLEPDLREVVELVVRSHILGDQVAVVVNDRHLGCMLMVETLGCRRLQQEIVVVKLFHSWY